MNEIDKAIDAVGLPVFLAVFTVVFVLSLLFASKLGCEGPLRVVFAFCVAALCATGLMVLGSSGTERGKYEFEPIKDFFLPLPYVVLGVSLFVLLLLVLLFRFAGVFRKDRKRSIEVAEHIQKPHSPRLDRQPAITRLDGQRSESPNKK